MKKKLKIKVDTVTNCIKQASRRWHVKPRDVLSLRTSKHNHPAYEARRDVVLELIERGFSRVQIAEIFQYRSVFPIACLLTEYKYTKTKSKSK
jgi:hypothetical protein